MNCYDGQHPFRMPLRRTSIVWTPRGDGDVNEAMHMTIGNGQPGETIDGSGQPGKEAPPKKIRVKNLQGKTLVARSIAVGGVGITCALENCGRQRPTAFMDAGIVYINIDHPLYRKQSEKGKDMLGFYLTYLLSQQVALLMPEGDARKVFDMQNRLLMDSW